MDGFDDAITMTANGSCGSCDHGSTHCLLIHGHRHADCSLPCFDEELDLTHGTMEVDWVSDYQMFVVRDVCHTSGSDSGFSVSESGVSEGVEEEEVMVRLGWEIE